MGGQGGCDGQRKRRVECASGFGAEGGVEGEDVGMAKEISQTALE